MVSLSKFQGSMKRKAEPGTGQWRVEKRAKCICTKAREQKNWMGEARCHETALLYLISQFDKQRKC